MATTSDLLAEWRAKAEKQEAAYARMLELDGGVGKLGIHNAQMFEDMLAWDDSTENGHADRTLALLSAVEAVLALHVEGLSADGSAWGGELPYSICSLDGDDWPCATIRAVSAALGTEEGE